MNDGGKKNDKQILRQYLWNDFAVLCVCGEKARDDGIREIPYWFVFHLISFCLVLVLVLVFGASFTNWSYTNNKLYVVCCAMCLYYTTHNIFIVMTSVLLLLSARSRSLSLFIAFIAFRSSASIAPNTKKKSATTAAAAVAAATNQREWWSLHLYRAFI